MRNPSFQALTFSLALVVSTMPEAHAGTVPTRTEDQTLLWDYLTELPPGPAFGATLALADTPDASSIAIVGAPQAGAAQRFSLGPGATSWVSHPPILPTAPQYLPVTAGFYLLYAMLDSGGATTSLRHADSGQVEVSGIDGGWVWALVMDGTTLAIGQPDFFGGSGRVRIYEQQSPGSWMLAKTFVGGFADQLGRGLAIDGPVIVAGAPGRGDNGAVHVYARAGSWIELQEIVSPASSQTGADFGWAVALDGDLLAVGSPYLDRTTAPGALTDAGGGYVYEVVTLPFLEFELQALLRPAEATDHDWFGWSVDLAASPTGSVELVAGAIGEDDGGVNAGAVYRYLRTGNPHASSWHLVHRLKRSEPLDYDQLGTTVALGAAGVLAGAPYTTEHPGTPGAVLFFGNRIFADGFESGDTSAWTETFP